MPACGYEFYLRVFNSIAGYRVEHEKIKSVSTSGHLVFCLFYKHTNDAFDDFPKISQHYPKIFEDSSKVVRRPDKRFQTFSEVFRRLLEIIEDFPGRTDDASIIKQHI